MIRVLRTVLSVVLCLQLLPTTKSPGDETAATQIWARQALLNKGAADRARNGLESHRLPFSFMYAGAPSAKFLASWNATTTDITPADGKEKHVINVVTLPRQDGCVRELAGVQRADRVTAVLESMADMCDQRGLKPW
jgi:hypothetical protein